MANLGLVSRFIFPVIQTALMKEILRVRIYRKFDRKFPVSCFLTKRKNFEKNGVDILSLFDPRRVFSHLVGKGTSVTGVKEFRSLFNFSSSFPAIEEITMISVFKNLIVSPIAASFLGFAVRSLPSPLRAFPLQTFLISNLVICNLAPLICNL